VEREPRATKEQIYRAAEELETVLHSTGETASEEAKAKIRDRVRFLTNAGEGGIAVLSEVVMMENTESVAVALQELAAIMRLQGRNVEKLHGTALLLKVAANHQSITVRVAAVALLGEMKIEESLQLLTEIARTAVYSELKEGAALAVAKIGSPKAVQALIEIARLPGESEQVNAIRGLAYCRGPEVVSFLLETLSVGEESVRAEAALALGKMGDKNISTQLKDSFFKETSDAVAIACAKALANLAGGSETARWLREQISGTKSEAEKLRALVGLAGIGGQSARDVLFVVAKDDQETESIRIAAIKKLDLPAYRESMRDSVIQFLKDVAEEDKSEAVRAAASTLLEQWGVTKEPKQPEEPSPPPQPQPLEEGE
jgi:HEAT repeat protein